MNRRWITMNIKEKLASKKFPEIQEACSAGIKTCEQIFLSGQLPIDPKTNTIVEGGISQQTKQCLENMKTLLQECDLDMKYVVKTTVFLKDLNDFEEMDKVYAHYFTEPYPARTCCEVCRLRQDAFIEIEATVIDFRALEVLCMEEEEECDGKSCCCK